ncbi:hypothetical protein ATO6_06710 [Oceanicola sp. 22II-s10i]|nr:hypothetical protein ATO6_06710 [Oceanicola sp. 22II-s10i]
MVTAEAFWDGVAAKYAERPIGDMAAYDATLERVASYLEPGDRVLEHGAGTGTTAIRLAPLVSGYVAADISGALLGIARERAAAQGAEGIEFRHAGLGRDTGADAAAFDAVMAFNLLHLMPDPQSAIHAMADAARPGGVVITKTACLNDGMRYLRPVLWIMRKLGRAPAVNIFSAAELDRMFEEAGLKIVETGWYSRKGAARFVVARKV